MQELKSLRMQQHVSSLGQKEESPQSLGWGQGGGGDGGGGGGGGDGGGGGEGGDGGEGTFVG